MSDPDASLAAAAPTTVEGGGRLSVPAAAPPGPPRWSKRSTDSGSFGRDAWSRLTRRPLFWLAAATIAVFVLMAVFPGLFTSKDPSACDLSLSRQAPQADAWFGYDLLGCDVYATSVYGARASIAVGVLATTATMFIAVVVGTLAGYFGGWFDAILSRLTDVFFAIPLLLGAILVLTTFPTSGQSSAARQVLTVVLALTLLGWPAMARIMRASVLQARTADYVTAARALGASHGRIIARHVLPNALTPLIVVATIAVGGFIAAEATLSFLGLGLQPPVISWGQMIDDAARYIRVSPHMLLFPSLFLSLTVLAFITLGDLVRDAFDPRLR